MPADPEKKALAEKLVREEKARWKAEWLEGQRIKKCVWRMTTPALGPNVASASGVAMVVACIYDRQTILFNTGSFGQPLFTLLRVHASRRFCSQIVT